MNFDLDKLNPMQKSICLHTEGALMVIAGAGSGKTRTLTHRIAHLVNTLHVPAYNILAITFTNKATNEMKERLSGMYDSHKLWIFTFHGLCLRILKRGAEAIGYQKGFSIYGETEKKTAIKRIIKDKSIDDEVLKDATHLIGDAKSKGIDPDQFLKEYPNIRHAEDVDTIYRLYQEKLLECNALDFDDMLSKTLELLKTDNATLEYFSNMFRYIHVDEFQDTNKIQYDIVKLLASKHKNVFSVGDEDQSIYGWRGASIDNIKLYLHDFDAKLYKLEQNYRSSKGILDIANLLISNNTSRIDKNLWTDKGEGIKPVYYPASSDSSESDYVVELINQLIHKHNIDPNEIAILMRVNAFSRNFEKKLVAYNIPHRVQGGFKFFDRKEIKDILAYFRLALNPKDNDAFVRVLNFPKKGMGETSIANLYSVANLTRQSLYEVVTDYSFYQSLPKGLVSKLIPFAEVLKSIVNNSNLPLMQFVNHIYNLLDIKNIYGDNSEDSYNRLLNLEEFANDVAEKTQSNPDMDLEEFLDTVTLYSDDALEDDQKNAVTISTIHSAKGLEYQVVFVVGCEEYNFPLRRSMDSTLELEEERRLMYVAITRAKRLLYLTSCQNRFMYDGIKDFIPSRFLKECGFETYSNKNRYGDEYSNKNRYGDENSYSGSKYKSNSSSYTTDEDDSPGKIYKPTASHIAKPKPVAPTTKDLSMFQVGTIVEHKKFGKGTIVSLSDPSQANLYAEIEFEAMGKMTLAIGYAPLTIIE